MMDRPAITPITPISGIVVVDKPEGVSSMGVCRVVRGKLRTGGAPKRIKVGHGGTLDPLATGVLVVLVGKATKLCDRVMIGEKRYTAGVDLSAFSETDDREGQREEVEVPEPPPTEEIVSACARFVGEIMQRPPAYSAMKVNGQRAYKLARAGMAPRLEPRPVVIHACEVISYHWPIATLDIRCGKGTYIRSLARDLGVALGTGGMLASLRRTAVGPFLIDAAVALDDLPQPMSASDLTPAERYLQPESNSEN